MSLCRPLHAFSALLGSEAAGLATFQRFYHSEPLDVFFGISKCMHDNIFTFFQPDEETSLQEHIRTRRRKHGELQHGDGLVLVGERKTGRTSLSLALLGCHLFWFSCRCCWVATWRKCLRATAVLG